MATRSVQSLNSLEDSFRAIFSLVCWRNRKYSRLVSSCTFAQPLCDSKALESSGYWNQFPRRNNILRQLLLLDYPLSYSSNTSSSSLFGSMAENRGNGNGATIQTFGVFTYITFGSCLPLPLLSRTLYIISFAF